MSTMNSMNKTTICWRSIWNTQYPETGLEYAVLDALHAESVILCVAEDGMPAKISYRLTWNQSWELISADIQTEQENAFSTLDLRTDGKGCWRTADGKRLHDVDGCIDIDIWPTPFTNSFPLRRCPLKVGKRKEFRMAWVNALTMSLTSLPQAYTRLSENTFLYESLDDGFKAVLEVDDDLLVTEYEGMFRRIA